MTIALFATLPFFYEKVVYDFTHVGTPLLLGVIKGLFFYGYINSSQKVAKETASSRAFLGAMAAGIIAIINFCFLEEKLSDNQLISAVLMTTLGFIYYFKGHISKSSLVAQRAFLFVVLN